MPEPKNDNAAEDDLFGGNPVRSNEPAKEESLNSLFEETPADKPADEESPKEEPKANESDSNIDDLFGKYDDNLFKGAEFRNWQDNTGSFATEARLVTIYPDKVKLLKANGKYASVPFRRLSPSDKLYVQWVAAKLSPDKELKFVSAPNASAAR